MPFCWNLLIVTKIHLKYTGVKRDPKFYVVPPGSPSLRRPLPLCQAWEKINSTVILFRKATKALNI